MAFGTFRFLDRWRTRRSLYQTQSGSLAGRCIGNLTAWGLLRKRSTMWEDEKRWVQYAKQASQGNFGTKSVGYGNNRSTYNSKLEVHLRWWKESFGRFNWTCFYRYSIAIKVPNTSSYAGDWYPTISNSTMRLCIASPGTLRRNRLPRNASAAKLR